jgi:toxin ParE1/3/4
MAQVRWTPQAADDLEAIVEFISLDSEHYARLFALDLVAVVEKLGVSPRRGRVVPEAQAPNIREVFFGNYRVIYRLTREVVEVLTIYHGARLLNPDRLDR